MPLVPPAGGEGSGMMRRPAGVFDKAMSSSNQARFRVGSLLPKNSNWRGMAGCSQMELWPLPDAAEFSQEKVKLSPRRSFAIMTTFRCARTRSSNSTLVDGVP